MTVLDQRWKVTNTYTLLRQHCGYCDTTCSLRWRGFYTISHHHFSRRHSVIFANVARTRDSFGQYKTTTSCSYLQQYGNKHPSKRRVLRAFRAEIGLLLISELLLTLKKGRLRKSGGFAPSRVNEKEMDDEGY